jgi:hypothetical protein
MDRKRYNESISFFKTEKLAVLIADKVDFGTNPINKR